MVKHMAKPTRRESRETAFMLLFEWSFSGDPLDEILENAITAREAKIDRFARDLAEKVIAHQEELDLLVEQYSQGWRLQRISKTALTALRMSFCELTRFEDIPVGVTINEAVELLKKFGTDEEAAYLNGILGNFEKVLKGLKEAPPLPEKEAAPEIDSDAQQEQQVQNIQQEQGEHKERDEVELLDDIVIEVD